MKGVGGEEGKVSSKVELRLPSLLLPSLFRKPSSLSNVFGSSVIYYSVLSSIILDTGRILSRTKALCSDLSPVPRFFESSTSLPAQDLASATTTIASSEGFVESCAVGCDLVL